MDPFITVAALSRALAAGEISSTEVVEACLSRIEAVNPKVNAVVTIDAERARQRARAADEARARGEPLGALHGVPFTLKDCHATAGMRTTVGFEALADHVPDFDGAVAERLRKAGAILLGKTNVPPLLMSAQTNNPIFGRTNNPFDVERTAGGSSGGAGAAVAAGLVPFDIGSDMSGSIRMPASYCGIFGLKPTVHRIPLTGHIPPMPNTVRPDRMLATVGPMARCAEDLSLIASVLVGPDGQDLEVAPVPWRDAPRPPVKALRIAFLPAFPGVPTARVVRETVERVARELAGAGARVEERIPGFTVDALNEVWRECFRLFGPVIGELMGASLPIPAPEGPTPALIDWVRALDRRDALIGQLEELLSDFDAYLSPACISPAFPHGPPKSPIEVDGELVESRFVDHYLYPFNLTGHPAVVVPAGLADGLPIGVQLVGRRFGDENLLGVAAAVAEVIGGFRPPTTLLS